MNFFNSKVIVFIIVAFLGTGCADWVEKRSFIKEMEETKDGFFVPDRDFPVLSGDTGTRFRTKKEMTDRIPFSHKKRRKLERRNSLRRELRSKEKRLSERESRNYHRHQNYFKNDSEKIFYLNLPVEERIGYLLNKRGHSEKYWDKKHNFSSLEKRAIRRRQLYVGMKKDAVTKSWGRPEKIEYAGNPKMGHEKWTFYHGQSRKSVYFESGFVQGWEIN
jgi:hypothetical protein